jgi:tetratricopeptide (TPR) repeat protein
MTGMIHPREEDLAALAEGRLLPEQAASLERHLAACRSCMAAYTDAVRYRAGWLATPEAFEPAPDLIERGVAVRRTSADRATAVGGEPRGRRVAWAGATLGLGLVLVVGIFLQSDFRSRSESRRVAGPIRVALEDLSGRGLVLAEGEAGAASSGPVLRSGLEQAGPELSTAVREARARYEAGRGRGANAYPVAAGLHCMGQTDAARDYIDEGLRRNSNDVRLLILRADIAYRDSDLDGAERSLRQALATGRGTPAAALDLGIVLAELHRREEAARLFEETAKNAPAPIAARARRELEALEAR